jgi:hypothetical protein
MKFDVAVWRVWSFSLPVSSLPDYFGRVEAPSAFLAIAGVMRFHRLRSVPHAAAIARDGSIAYRAYRLRLAPVSEHVGESRGASDEPRSIKQAPLWM